MLGIRISIIDQLLTSNVFKSVGIKIVNSLPSSLTSLIQKKEQFKVALRDTYLHTPFTLLINL
jgi:hypothetical protein